MPPEKLHWAHLFDEVVTSGLCTGCAGCIVACPYDVLGYDDGTYTPFHVEADGGPSNCTHGEKGCTLCTRACPRFRGWEQEVDNHLFGRQRQPEEPEGVVERALLVRATDEELVADGQDGGLVSAILVWALESGYVDAALVSYLEGDGKSWKAVPGVARNRQDVLAAAGSRYTYSANPLAYEEAVQGGAERIALVGMSCQASLAPVMAARRAGKVARRLALTIGLLCSKTFDDSFIGELLEGRYGLRREDLVKMNIKGRLQLWDRDGAYHEVPLKECHEWTRQGCKSCPDFAAEHADISAGGICTDADWTLTLVRTARGAEVIDSMEAEGLIELRPAEEDPAALELLKRLSRTSRRRWPETATPGPEVFVAPPRRRPEGG